MGRCRRISANGCSNATCGVSIDGTRSTGRGGTAIALFATDRATSREKSADVRRDAGGKSPTINLVGASTPSIWETTTVYTFSPDDYKEMSGIWGNGEMALPGDPKGEARSRRWFARRRKNSSTHRHSSAFTPDYAPEEMMEIATKLYKESR